MDIDLRYGDAIEVANIEWIRAEIPEYEHLWAKFIGHDGQGRPLKCKGLTEISEDNRKSFFQAHYTVLLCLLTLRDLSDDYKKHSGEVQTVNQYLHATRDTVTFIAHLGRLRDMFKKIDAALNFKNSLWKQFDDFYAQRNNLLHGSLPAHRFSDGFLQIPTPAKRAALNTEWTDESKWDNADSFSFVFLADFFQDTHRGAVKLARSGICQCLTRLKELAPTVTKPIQVFTAPPVYTSGSEIQPLSGVHPALSGSSISFLAKKIKPASE